MGRAERRLAEKLNRKTNNISRSLRSTYQDKVNRILDDSANKFQKELEKYHDDYLNLAIENWGWFYALASITLKRDYHRNTEQIGKFIERCEKLRTDCFNAGISQDELLKICERETDICLQSE